MKKKLGSLLLTLCMLLALLPTSVLAADPADSAVTITEAGGTVHGYATVSEAFAAVGSYPNSTVKLMQNIAVTSQVTVASGTFTLDLNGKTWRNASYTHSGGVTTEYFTEAGGGSVYVSIDNVEEHKDAVETMMKSLEFADDIAEAKTEAMDVKLDDIEIKR